ncbi:M48 family metalloprotease [Pseudaeromonas sharmana]|uniref:Putative beta-barrel assembly-enhancing protease n=1 Tax=Pseudaeromonas sharmana TaxID=328412 RepID=A0ABV8CSD5_9GAMM
MNKTRIGLSIAGCLLLASLSASVMAMNESQLPDIGTAGVSALTIDREVMYGEAFLRQARAQLPIVDDPVLSDYLDDLGQRLVSHASDVRFPFTFFLVRDDTINAAAFLGGKVKVHTGLFLNADNESELASVLAHEISHVTQRHIARYMEAQTRQAPVTMAGLVGSVALAILNPAAGIAALQTTMGIQAQTAINYTRDNEFEADRIGMKLLNDAGFEPMGMATFFQKLAATYRYASKPPEMLLTHPLPETRITEARNRAASYRVITPHDNLNFNLAKARIQVRFSSETADGMLSYFDRQLKRTPDRADMLYGKALALLAQDNSAAASPIITELAQRYPDNLFVLDTQTDIDMSNHQAAKAIQRLEQWQRRQPDNSVVVFNLASGYLQQGQASKAARLLDLYVRNHPDSSLGWRSLVDAYQQSGDETNMHIALSESRALMGDYQRAMDELNLARATSNDKLVLARIDARQVQLEEAKRLDESLRQ